MHLAALPRCTLEVPSDTVHQAFMVIAHHQLHSMKAAVFEAAEQLVVTRFVLRVSHTHSQDLPEAIAPDALHYQHTHALDAAVEPDFLVTSINQQVRNRLLQRPDAPCFELLIERHHQATDGALAETRTAQLLSHCLHLAGADTFNIHLHQGAHQRLLRPLVPLEQLRLKRSLPILRHQQVQRSDPCFQLTGLMPVAVPTSFIRTHVRRHAQMLSHLCFQELMQTGAQILITKPIIIQQRLMQQSSKSVIIRNSHRYSFDRGVSFHFPSWSNDGLTVYNNRFRLITNLQKSWGAAVTRPGDSWLRS